MSTEPIRYQKLPGSGRRLQGIISAGAARCRLWLGPDHLLSVDRIWTTEEYRRFYFRDIQAITVFKTKGSAIANTLLAITLALIGLGFWLVATNASSEDERVGWFISLSVIGTLFLVLFIMSLVRGTSCRCHIQTAVQTEQLPSLGRINNARKVIARLIPLIEQSQQGLAVPPPAAAPEPSAPFAPPATSP